MIDTHMNTTFDPTLVFEILRKPDLQVEFKPGEIIYREGDPGDGMYVLLEGVVEVLVGGKSVGSFEPIEFFGEMAVIDPGPRSATVRAATKCKLAPISQIRFLALIERRPHLAILIMRMLVERIRWLNSVAAGQGPPTQDGPTEAAPSDAVRHTTPEGVGALSQ